MMTRHTRVTTPEMAPITSLRSIRLRNELWDWLKAEAERRSTTVNGLVADLLEVARLRAEEAKAAPNARSPEKDVKPRPAVKAPLTAREALVPLAGTFKRKPYQKGAKK